MTIYDDSSESDRSQLISFVSTVYDDLAWVVDMRYALFPSNLESPEGSFDDLSEFLAWLADAWPGVYDTRDELLQRIGTVPTEQLHDHGLSGLDPAGQVDRVAKGKNATDPGDRGGGRGRRCVRRVGRNAR